MSWHPGWKLRPAPRGDDEPQVRVLYVRFVAELSLLGENLDLPDHYPEWDELEEWKKESWRREYRDLSPEERKEVEMATQEQGSTLQVTYRISESDPQKAQEQARSMIRSNSNSQVEVQSISLNGEQLDHEQFMQGNS